MPEQVRAWGRTYIVPDMPKQPPTLHPYNPHSNWIPHTELCFACGMHWTDPTRCVGTTCDESSRITGIRRGLDIHDTYERDRRMRLIKEEFYSRSEQ